MKSMLSRTACPCYDCRIEARRAKSRRRFLKLFRLRLQVAINDALILALILAFAYCAFAICGALEPAPAPIVPVF